MIVYSKMMPFGVKGGLQETITLESERESQRSMETGPGTIGGGGGGGGEQSLNLVNSLLFH